MRMTVPDFDPDFADAAAWAAMYRAAGLQVIPCWEPGEAKDGSWKRPKLAGWQPLQETLQGDAPWARWYGLGGEHAKREQMGFITGRCSQNRWVLDLDIHKHPEAQAWWNATLEAENNGIEPETVQQITGGGGRQLVFEAPPGFTVPTGKTDIGVDVRGQGGFAVLPPSLHESGKHYQWVDGYAPWEIPVAMAPPWLLEAIVDLLEARQGEAPAGERTASPAAPVNEYGQQTDSREQRMRDVVWHAVLELRRAAPMKPLDTTQAMENAYRRYESLVAGRGPIADRTSALEADGRGPTEFRKKWARAMRHWGSPKMEKDANQPNPNEGKGANPPPPGGSQTAGQNYELLDVREIKALPDPVWLIDGMVSEQSMGFIYGPPASLKTFIALDLALSITTGLATWWNRAIKRRGAVIYVSSEGQANLKFRIMAWEANRKTVADAAPFYLLRQTLNFMKADDVNKLLATIEEAAAKAACPIAAVFVDTVSRVLPGAEENQQKDMTLFVAACDAIRQRFSTVVFGIHHVNKSGEFRGSTVMPGAGDFLIEVRREPGEMTGSIVAKKIKDAEDGWEQGFEVKTMTVGTLGLQTSLAVDPTATVKQDSGWPDRTICQEILTGIEEQWRKGAPWCFASNTPRSAVRNVMRKWRLDRKLVIEMLETWTVNGIIEEQVFDVKNHISGYRKLMGI
jgi:hypothetical protein